MDLKNLYKENICPVRKDGLKMKNFKILIDQYCSYMWVDICGKCLDMKSSTPIDSLTPLEIKPSPCACIYCGKKGE